MTLRTEWSPLIDQYNVDLVLAGHDHDYERTKVMRGIQAFAEGAPGTIYVVSGGAGAELYEDGFDFWTEKHASLHSAAIVRVRRNLIDFLAFDETGAMVDSFMRTK